MLLYSKSTKKNLLFKIDNEDQILGTKIII